MNRSSADNFLSYIDHQIEPSVQDIKNLKDASRKHVQKLIYTNLVDRFDVMVDNLVLENCRSDHVIETISPALSETINESYLLKLLMDAESVQEAIDERLKVAVRNTVLRKRHSLKLQFMLKMFNRVEYSSNRPQVQPGNGNVVATAKVTKVNVPHSVCGYADWLYSRRNAVVHGAGKANYLKNDKIQIKRLYRYECPKTFNLKIGAINSSINFYKCVADLLSDVGS